MSAYDSDFEQAWALNEKLFRGPLQDVTVATQAMKLDEEVNEFLLALRDHYDNGYSREGLDKILAEAVDIQVVVTGILIKLGAVGVDDYTQAFIEKSRRNLNRIWNKQDNGTFQHDPSTA